MADKKPWELHSDLTEDRLKDLAQLLRRARNDALDRFDPNIGDDTWTLGCRAFQFARHQISVAAKSGRYPWLTIQDPSRQFVFRIGGVPVRFYRGTADEPTARTLHQSFPELGQLALVFPEEAIERNYAYRFAIETDTEGFISSIWFVALLGDTPMMSWEVPLDAEIRAIHAVDETLAEGVELEAPTVLDLDSEDDAASEDGTAKA